VGLQIVLALWLPIDTLAQATTTIMLVVFIAVNLALIVLKTRGPTPADAFACPAWVPWAGVLTSVGLLVAQATL
jgi:amino acid transporter